MKFVLSTIALLILVTALCAGEKRSKWQWAITNSSWQWATTPANVSPCSAACVCGCNANGACTCKQTAQPAAITKPTEVPVGNCASGTCSAPTTNYITTESGSCSSGNCSAPARYSRRGR